MPSQEELLAEFESKFADLDLSDPTKNREVWRRLIRESKAVGADAETFIDDWFQQRVQPMTLFTLKNTGGNPAEVVRRYAETVEAFARVIHQFANQADQIWNEQQ